MRIAPTPLDEIQRIQKLYEYRVLDTFPEEIFDDLTRTAAAICGTEIALVCLVDSNRQWFKSKYGLNVNETPRDISYCGHAIMNDEPFIIEDSSKDERFFDNPLVTGFPFIKFYAGIPLVTPGKFRIGTLCVIDPKAKTLNESQITTLKALAKLAVSYLELRKKNAEINDINSALVTSRQRYELILKSMLEGVVVRNKDGVVVDYNKAALNILGIDESGIQQLDIFNPKWKPINLDGSHFPPHMHPAFESLRTGNTVKDFILGVEVSGQRKWISINTSPMKVIHELFVVTTFSDVTQMLNSQQAKIREFEDILSATPSCLKIMDNKGHIVEVNQQGLDLVEWEGSVEDVLGECAYEFIAPEFRNDYARFNERVCAGNHESMVFQVIGLKGTSRWVETYAAPYILPNGEKGSVSISNDISARVRHEEELKLQREIANHQSKLATIGELAAGVGHEINNPLAAIKGHVEVAKDLIADEFDKTTILDKLSKITVAAGRIEKIVKGLRSFSRADKSDMVAFNFSPILKDTVDMFREMIHGDGYEVSLECDQDAWVYGNEGRLQQVIVNLIANARDALAKKDIKKIDVSLKIDGDKINILVRDNGTGIPESIKEKIFNPFFTTKEINKGTGIGLSLVRSIMLEHYGDVSVDSEIGEWTCFKLILPLSEEVSLPKQVEKDELKELVPELAYEGKVLIVDDEDDLREILAFKLMRLKVDCLVAQNGAEAMDMVSQYGDEIKMIISDVKMPVMDGPQLLKGVKETLGYRGKFYFITGGHSEDLKKLVDSVDGYFAKPYKIDLIEAEVKKNLKAES